MRLRGARVDAEAEAVHRIRLGRRGARDARVVRVRGDELRRARARDERGVEIPVAVQREPDALAAASATLHQIRDREVAASAYARVPIRELVHVLVHVYTESKLLAKRASKTPRDL